MEKPSELILEPRAARTPSAEEIQAWIVERVARSLDTAPAEIDVQQPLARYGLDSVQLVVLVSDMEQWLGLRFTKNPLGEQSTIQNLAEHLASLARPVNR